MTGRLVQFQRLTMLIVTLGLFIAANIALAQPVVPQDEMQIVRQLVAHDDGLTYAVDQGWLQPQTSFESNHPETGELQEYQHTFAADNLTFTALYAYMDTARVTIWFMMEGVDAFNAGAPSFSLTDETDAPWYLLRAQHIQRFGNQTFGYVDFSFVSELVPYEQMSPSLASFRRSSDPAVSPPLELHIALADSRERFTVHVAVDERPAPVIYFDLVNASEGFVIESLALSQSEADDIELEVWTQTQMMAESMSRAQVCIGWDLPSVYPVGYIENIGYTAQFTVFGNFPLVSENVLDDIGRKAKCVIVEASVPANYQNAYAVVQITGWVDDEGNQYLTYPPITLQIGFV